MADFFASVGKHVVKGVQYKNLYYQKEGRVAFCTAPFFLVNLD